MRLRGCLQPEQPPSLRHPDQLAALPAEHCWLVVELPLQPPQQPLPHVRDADCVPMPHDVLHELQPDHPDHEFCGPSNVNAEMMMMMIDDENANTDGQEEEFFIN